MSVFTVPNVFVANTKIKSASVNANFAAIASTLNTNLLPAVGNTNALVTTDSGGNLQSVLPLGTEGQTLVVDPTATSTGGLRFATPSAGTSQSELYNVGLGASVTSGALTISLKQGDGVSDPAAATGAVLIAIRNPSATVGGYNERSVTAPLSMTLSLGTTLGMVPAQNNSLWIYAVDTDGAGTMALACSTLKVDEGQLQTILPESIPVTTTIASPCVMTGSSLSFSTNDGVTLTTTGALPTGLSTGTRYYIQNPGSTSANLSGIAVGTQSTTVNTSGSQSGVHTAHVANCNLVSNAAYLGVAVRLIGKFMINLTSVGNWVLPASIQIYPSLNIVESTAALYSGSTVAIGSGFEIISNTTPTYDSHGLVDLAGQFVAPANGILDVNNIWTTNIAPLMQAVGDSIAVDLWQNALDVTSLNAYTVVTTSGVPFKNVTGGTSIIVNKGDCVVPQIIGTGSLVNQVALGGGSQANTTSYSFSPVLR